MSTFKNLSKFVAVIFITTILSNSSAQEKRNVLFLMADDFNYWTSKNGYYPLAQTPNLDRLGEKGVFFLDAHCASPVCNPSRNALMSGYRPSTTGITSNAGGFVREKTGFENIISMHQYFMQNGYFTHGAGKLWHPGTMGGAHTDPENWTSLNRSGSGCQGGNLYRFGLKSKSNYVWSANPNEMTSDNCADLNLALNTAEIISTYHESEHKDKPFFIACGVFRPHMPWNAPKEFWDFFKREDILPPKGYNGEKGNEVHREIIENNRWEEAIHAYLASCKLADHNIGIMLDALESSSYSSNTIVVFMGDHGWHLGEKGHWGKFSTWDEANHTTMIIYDPIAKGNGRVCKKVVSMQDIYPTLVELAGLPPRTNIEGRSLAPLLENPVCDDWNWPILMSHDNTHYIKTNQYRFISNGDNSFLSNVIDDPYEWNNLYGKPGYDKVVERLHYQMDSMMAIGSSLKGKLLSNYQFVPKPLVIPGVIEAEDYDEGANTQTYFDITPQNSGKVYRNDAVDLAITNDITGAYHITDFNSGEWLQYTIADFLKSEYKLVVRARNAGKKSAKLNILVNGKRVASLNLPKKAAKWNDYVVEGLDLSDIQYLRLRLEAEGNGIELNNMKFIAIDNSMGFIDINDDGSGKYITSTHVNNKMLNFDFTYTNPSVKVEIFDEKGSILMNDYLPGEKNVDLILDERFTPGTYLAVFNDGSGSKTEKFYID